MDFFDLLHGNLILPTLPIDISMKDSIQRID
jgi:hypothetical protein